MKRKEITYTTFLLLLPLYVFVQFLLHNPYVPAIFSKDTHTVT